MNTAATQSLQGLSGLLGTGSSAPAQATDAQTSVQGASKQALGMGNFLTLFTTQLKYQDPSSPLQSHELAAQLAQFSTVEQLTTLNTNMKEVQAYLASISNAQMINLIGKEVVGTDSTLRLTDGKISNASYETAAPADVTVSIYNEDGVLVRTISAGQQAAGKHQVTWDGRNNTGQKLANGNYTFKVEAVGADGNQVDVKSTIRGTVYSFRLEDGIPYLVLGGADGIKLPVNEVQEITQPAA
jgi:flagellar basal-body rod modification protein FlgD